jgi:hypothetical protein
MTAPVRKPTAPVEATQELQALDVIEILDTLKPKVPAPRKSIPSNSSIAPVGLDLAASRDDGIDEEADATMGVRLPSRRRRLGGIVVGAVAGCGLILLAAVIARAGHASSEPASASTPVQAATPATTASPAPGAATTPASSPAASPVGSPASAPPPAAAGGDPSSSTGTVRLDRPAVAGQVWLDGKRLTSKSALVSCGTHQIKVGFKRAHSIDVPCGGEVGVSK